MSYMCCWGRQEGRERTRERERQIDRLKEREGGKERFSHGH